MPHLLDQYTHLNKVDQTVYYFIMLRLNIDLQPNKIVYADLL